MPTATDDWFWDWAVRHQSRFPRPDWPSLDSEFWGTLRRTFITRGVTEPVADEASRLLFEDPPSYPDAQPRAFYPDAHPKALLEKIRLIWRERETRSIPPRAGDDAVQNALWEREAKAHWDRLPDAEREETRRLVRERLPELSITPRWLERLAMGWAYDPSKVAGPPPEESWHPVRKGPVQVLSGGLAIANPRAASISDALQFLVGVLSVKPTRLAVILAGAREFRISRDAIFDAAEKLEIARKMIDGEEIWDLEQGSNK